MADWCRLWPLIALKKWLTRIIIPLHAAFHSIIDPYLSTPCLLPVDSDTIKHSDHTLWSRWLKTLSWLHSHWSEYHQSWSLLWVSLRCKQQAAKKRDSSLLILPNWILLSDALIELGFSTDTHTHVHRSTHAQEMHSWGEEDLLRGSLRVPRAEGTRKC